LQWDASHIDTNISIRRVLSSGGIAFSRSANSASKFSLSDSRIVGEPWNYEVSHMTSGSTAGTARLTSARVSTSRLLGKVQTNISLDAQQGRGPLTVGTQTTVEDIALQSIRLNATYPVTSGLTLASRLSLSNVKAGPQSGLGRDIALSAAYEPNNRLTMYAGYVDSASGELALLSGFQTGLGVGYNGNGFSGGVGTGQFATGVTDYRQLRFNSTYRFSDRLQASLSAQETRYAGSVSSNTTTKAIDFGLDAQLGPDTFAFFNLSQSDTSFIGSLQASNATILSAGIGGRAFQRLSYDVRLNWLTSGGTSGFDQDDMGLDVTLGYRLAQRQHLSLVGRFGRTTGYLPQDDNLIEASYSYQIWKPVAIVGTYRFRQVRNHDNEPAGAYRASGLDIQLRFGF
jgi:hypothetical protein